MNAHRLSQRNYGFTVLDLLIALTIASLLFGIALPSYRAVVSRVHVSAVRSTLTTTLFDSLRDSTIRGQEVVVCPAVQGHCTDGQDWSVGWFAFVDLNGDRSHSANEPILREQRPLDRDVHLRSTAGRPRIVYQPNGSNAGSNVTFTLCDRRGPSEALSLILANNGRLRSQRAPIAAATACAAGL